MRIEEKCSQSWYLYTPNVSKFDCSGLHIVPGELTPHTPYHWPLLAAAFPRVAASEDVASHVCPLADRPLVSPENLPPHPIR